MLYITLKQSLQTHHIGNSLSIWELLYNLRPFFGSTSLKLVNFL